MAYFMVLRKLLRSISGGQEAIRAGGKKKEGGGRSKGQGRARYLWGIIFGETEKEIERKRREEAEAAARAIPRSGTVFDIMEGAPQMRLILAGAAQRLTVVDWMAPWCLLPHSPLTRLLMYRYPKVWPLSRL